MSNSQRYFALQYREVSIVIAGENGAAPRSRRVAAIATCLAILAAGGAVYWYWVQGPNPAHAARPPARAAVPVNVATAARQDIPLYLTGLGTVQASFTIAIHSQVDGKLQEVLFTEGQQVKKGDVLARIDPRLFQAALDQAKAKKAQDEAQLISADKDLTRSKTLVLQNVTSQQIVDQQQAKVDQLKASVDADQAAIQTAQTQLDYTAITAPSDGRIGVRHVAGAVSRRRSRRLGARAGRGHRLRSGQPARTRHRQASAHRQSDRPGNLDHPAQGNVSQRRRQAVAGRIRQCARAA
jgi:multidrug efflux pump subunit AcrA (membrane-fusion protein)